LLLNYSFGLVGILIIVCNEVMWISDKAEKTGEAIGEGVKKTAKAVNDFAIGVKKGIKNEE